MIITSAIDNAARMAKAESLKSACEKTSILSVLFPSEGLETTELSKRKRKVHRHILHRWDLCNYENLCQDLTSWTKKDHLQPSRHVRPQQLLQDLRKLF